MSNEAFETLLWQGNELEDIHSAVRAWESFGEPGQTRFSGAQIAQWKGAWRTYPEDRWMLLEVLESQLPNCAQWDAVKLWEALVETPNSDPDISKMRHKFLDMGYKSEDPKPIIFYAGVMLLGEMAKVGQLSVLDDCFDFARKHGGDEAVEQLFLRQANWIMKKLSGYSHENPPENNSQIWADTLDRLDEKLLGSPEHHDYLLLTWAQVTMEQQSWGMADWDSCLMLLSHLADRGLNLDQALANVLDLEQQTDRRRVSVAVDAILGLGADWKKVDLSKVSEASKMVVVNHPTARREKLMEQIGLSDKSEVNTLDGMRGKTL